MALNKERPSSHDHNQSIRCLMDFYFIIILLSNLIILLSNHRIGAHLKHLKYES
jgi:hypothetical protein